MKELIVLISCIIPMYVSREHQFLLYCFQVKVGLCGDNAHYLKTFLGQFAFHRVDMHHQQKYKV